MIVLVGFMGAGKSTVGRLLAARTGRPFVDTDALIEQQAGAPIATIFKTSGEAAFRSIETEIVAEVLTAEDSVVALGGGALDDPATCAALEWTTVVHLDVEFDDALRRIGSTGDRPMLTVADPKALFDRRRAAYERAAGVSIATTGKTPDEIVQELIEKLDSPREESLRRVAVRLGDRSYTVVVGHRIAGRLAEVMTLPGDARTAWLVTHPSLEELSTELESAAAGAGLKVVRVPIPEGESSKSLGVAAEVYEALAAGAAHRRDLVVAFGGGVVGDVAGWVASTYNRGMPLLHVPTSLLAQVDAAIGGKTGINLAAGKNLVGTFHQPIGVVCDVDFLRSLPDPEFRSGLAEVIKYGFISHPSILELISSRTDDILSRNPDILVELVARCAAVKAAIVSADEREAGPRAHLNYGHTWAHAIEQTTGFEAVRHGEAVALGMMAAAHLARALDRISDDVVELHRRTLEAVGLPTSATLDLAALDAAWTRDKKYQDGVRFVLLADVGRVEAGITAPRDAVKRALDALAETDRQGE